MYCDKCNSLLYVFNGLGIEVIYLVLDIYDIIYSRKV